MSTLFLAFNHSFHDKNEFIPLLSDHCTFYCIVCTRIVLNSFQCCKINSQLFTGYLTVMCALFLAFFTNLFFIL